MQGFPPEWGRGECQPWRTWLHIGAWCLERLGRSGAALGSAEEPPRPAEVRERRGFPGAGGCVPARRARADGGEINDTISVL